MDARPVCVPVENKGVMTVKRIFKCGFRMKEYGMAKRGSVKGLGTVSDVGRQTVLRQDLACKLGA